MNDNQEKNTSQGEETAEPITKRVAKFSAFIYLGLAIVIVITATVGIFNMSYDYDVEMPPISLPNLDFDTTPSQPETSVPKEESSVPEEPVINEQSGVDGDVQTSQPEEEPQPAFYCPVNGEIIKPYSMDALIFSETMQDYRVHSGVDISAPVGTPVLCFADGVVESIVEDYFNGYTVAVSHGGGVVTYYMNLSPEAEANIAVGAEVSAGQTIGEVGESSRAESAQEPHLHFEMRVNGVLVDPTKEMPK